ncbi:D-alanyl-D-alanine carboxypeptidase [Streptomyces sp. NPDC052225]|uniref:D-alanyl-D-alanine carboxypeptidase n=1 Tax=Streptomyces sp. NPDC052225 TaxID=3154949 RepID=UPI00343A766B
MAGTPDRSEEQKASGGTTPDERDPRLAVARTTPSGSGPAPSGVDQPTAVFSVRESGTQDAASPEDAAPEDATPEEPGDERLRAAVAAWVNGSGEDAGSGEPAEPEAAGEPEADAEPVGAASEDAEPKAAAAEPAGDADSEPVEPEEPVEPDVPVEPEAAEAVPAAEPAAAPEAAVGATSGAGSEADAAPKADAVSGSDAVAKTGAEPKGAADAAADAKPGAGSEVDAAPKADAVTGSDAVAKTGAESKGAADAKPGAGSEVDAAPKADAESAPDAEAKVADAAPTADAKSAPDADPKPDAEPKAADAEPKAADAKPKAADAKPDAEPKAADPKPDAESKAAPAVDHPTTAFKAVAPPVDQPTAMLKLPESDAERTSRFVPLKPLDDDANAKAKANARANPSALTGAPAEPPAPERTTQQPLPPKPPIDLLAELTNTPPPPETRVRTTVRRFKIWTPLVLLLVLVFAIVQAVRPLPTPTLSLTAQETVSFDGGKPSVPWPTQGQAAMDVNGIGSFGTSGSQKPVPIASIAKVMTVYLTLRDHPLKTGEKGPSIPVDAAAQKHYETGKAENESVVKVTEGQKISEYEALQAVMLPSANNIAKLLARWDTGSSSEDAFVEKMNKTAKELGMTNTTYTDPSGLDKTTVSTAADLVKLGRAAMENPVFKEISRQNEYTDLNGDKQKNFLGLVPTVAVGIKTGTTTAAGGNILFAAEKTVDGKTQTIIGAVLGQYGSNGVANIDEVTSATRKLIEAGQQALTAKKIVKKGDVVGEVDDGLGGTTPVVATKDVSAVGWSGLTVKLALDVKKGETVPHTAKAGTEVGVLTVGDGKNEATAVEVPVALQQDLAEPGLGAKIKRVG